ncbi:MAG: PIG-L family deacetylase [Mycobacteriales bacterium]
MKSQLGNQQLGNQQLGNQRLGNQQLGKQRFGSRLRAAGAAVAAAAVVAGVLAAAATPAGAVAAPKPAAGAALTVQVSTNPDKINVLGEWAHPDDDTSIVGPCAVWHQKYGVRCGIIQATRGEGGGNAIGPEAGTSLGLRRENEDRAAHYRSGTTELFYLDKVDFFYNQSAPLTQFFWGHDDTLRRVTHIIRQTQPDVYVGFTPTLAAGHGNHQQAGRFIWEGVRAAADPTMFPDQLTGPNRLSTWQVKKVVSGGSTTGTGGNPTAANCTTGFVPDPTNLSTVAGVWDGYDSPYSWPAGNLQGVTAGTPKTWAQVSTEGRLAYPTQSRTMYQGIATPSCARFGVTESFVPFQPNLSADGTPNPSAGLDNALLFGAAIRDPGGLPLGTQFYLTFSRFFNVANDPFTATVHARSGQGNLPAGRVGLTVPAGWKVSAAKKLGPITGSKESTATFTVTPAAGATAADYRVAAHLTAGAKTGYTDNVMQVVPAAEGRFHRWGKFGEYDNWVQNTAPSALRLGRSPAVQSIGAGESISVPVDVHNWSSTTQSGTVGLTLPAGFSADNASKAYPSLAAGASTSVPFTITNTDPALATSKTYPVGIATSYSAPAGTSSETLTLDLVPQTTIPRAATAPTLDGTEGTGEYTGPALDLSPLWQGSTCSPAGVDCGTASGAKPGDADSTYAKATWNADNLYFFVHVRDDTQSYAASPQQCVAHWLADSVEIQLDPRGNSSQTNKDTSTTFKTGIFPFTNDPTNTLGNPKANGPCWERDADNHQGYANGPLASTVPDAPNAPGMQVVSTASWVGNNDPGRPHAYAGGYYNLEVKIPMADLPAAVGPTDKAPTGTASTNTVDPAHLGFNITPYDEDNQLHIDQSTRLGWSAWGSVQSDPYNWGHAYLAGYTPPSGRSTTPTTPIIPATALQSADSPQTIWQSATNGVPFAGDAPAPAKDRIAVSRTSLSGTAATIALRATGSGRAHVFLWSGDHAYIPVYNSSCASDPFEPGFTPCAATDGTAPAWGTDMSGRLVTDKVVSVSKGARTVSIPLTSAQAAKLRTGGQAIVSFQTPPMAVGPTGGSLAGGSAAPQVASVQRERAAQALAMPLRCDSVITGSHRGDVRVSSGTTCLSGGTITGKVAVSGNGSFYAVGGTITGGVTGTGGDDLVLAGTAVGKSVLVDAMVGEVSLDGAQVAGAVSLRDNVTGDPVAVASNRITGLLGCSGNAPAPTNQDRTNTVRGPESGQCFDF